MSAPNDKLRPDPSTDAEPTDEIDAGTAPSSDRRARLDEVLAEELSRFDGALKRLAE